MDIRISQIYYDPGQLPKLETTFVPFDNTENPNREFAEYYIFEKEYASGKIQPDAHVGYVSWKFGAKTRLSGDKFLNFINANPGYDVYFINPFPLQVKFFRNLWLQGEFYHPGILELAQGIFRAAGYPNQLAKEIHDSSTALYCNYWVGNRRFWDTYMDFVQPLVGVLRSGLGEAEKQKLHSIADHGNDFSFIAFIIERLFTTLLNSNTSIRHLAYRHSYADIRRKYGHAGAVIHQIFPDNSRLLNCAYSWARR